MAEITRKRQGELVRGVLEILARHPDGLHVREVLTGHSATMALDT